MDLSKVEDIDPTSGMNWGNIWGETKDLFSMGANTWLQYQQGKRSGDFTGSNQREVYETPTTTAPEPNPPQVGPVGGVPLTYLAVGGLLLVGAVIVAKA
ncbi:hypothetical protein ACODM8_14390 [Vibrio ostreicida]|uniref:hypothetical protein n=1 Tax=Vibrio ostreicida TaxID=526588 RepID=UPI003B5931CD